MIDEAVNAVMGSKSVFLREKRAKGTDVALSSWMQVISLDGSTKPEGEDVANSATEHAPPAAGRSVAFRGAC